MHFILPYFIIILIVIQLYLKKSTRSGSERSKKYWEREQKANSTRKQDISSLNYIKWDDSLPAIDNSLTLADILNNSPEALRLIIISRHLRLSQCLTCQSIPTLTLS